MEPDTFTKFNSEQTHCIYTVQKEQHGKTCANRERNSRRSIIVSKKTQKDGVIKLSYYIHVLLAKNCKVINQLYKPIIYNMENLYKIRVLTHQHFVINLLNSLWEFLLWNPSCSTDHSQVHEFRFMLVRYYTRRFGAKRYHQLQRKEKGDSKDNVQNWRKQSK